MLVLKYSLISFTSLEYATITSKVLLSYSIETSGRQQSESQ